MPYVTINNKKGLTLYYELHGNPQNPVVVLLNGMFADTTSWALQLPALTTDFCVLCYDCRGQGKSDKPRDVDYTPAIHAADLACMCDSLALERVHVVGVSNGGTIALTFASHHPQRVNRMVIASSYAHTDVWLRYCLDSWLRALAVGGTTLRFDVSVPWVWGRTFLAAHETFIAPLRETVAHTSPEAAAALIRGAYAHDVRAALPTLPQPTLVLVGEEDVLTPQWYARDIADAIPHAQYHVLAHCGHAMPIEQPNEFNRIVQSFLLETAHTNNTNNTNKP